MKTATGWLPLVGAVNSVKIGLKFEPMRFDEIVLSTLRDKFYPVDEFAGHET